MSQEPEELLQAYREAGNEYAIAKAQFEFLDSYKKHLIANLMVEAEKGGAKTVAAQERIAYASAGYLTHLEGQREAQLRMANAAHRRQECELAIEIWRTRQADRRTERRAYGT